jgi:hypothetical protein
MEHNTNEQNDESRARASLERKLKILNMTAQIELHSTRHREKESGAKPEKEPPKKK